MDLRLEDLQTEETHLVDLGGATIGRDSRRSSLVIADPGVSGAHAKITARGGRYFIQDSNSSNGTFVDGTRLRGELELQDGFVIALHKYKFRVTIEGGGGGGAGDSTALFEPRVVPATKSKTTPQRQEKARTMGQSPTRTDAVDESPVDDEDEDDRSLSEPLPLPKGRAPAAARAREAPQDDDDDAQDDVEQPSDFDDAAGQLQGGFGRALAYYLAAVPKMALMPRSSITAMIDEQPIPALEKMGMIAWALPPALLTVFVTLLTTVVIGLASHSFGMGMLVSALISSAITIVVYAVAAFFFQPIATWWIKLLKGESNGRARTNWFVTVCTASALTLIVAGAGALFGLLAGVRFIGPFIQIVPLVLGLGASLITIYAAFAWHTHFRVIDWFPKIFIVLGCLLVASSAWSAIQLVRASVAGAGSGANMAAASSASADALKAQAELQARADAAIAQQKAMQGQNDTAAPATTGTTPAANTPPPTAPSTAVATATQTTATPVAKPVEPVAAPRPVEPRPAGKKGPLTFAEYSDQSDAIEKAVAEDPSLLSRTPGALALYKKLHAAGAKFKGGKGKVDSPQEHIRQAELYAATVDIVQELYGKLNAR